VCCAVRLAVCEACPDQILRMNVFLPKTAGTTKMELISVTHSVFSGLYLTAAVLHAFILVYFIAFQYHRRKSLCKLFKNRFMLITSLAAASCQCHSWICLFYFLRNRSPLTPFVSRNLWAPGVVFNIGETMGHAFLLKMRVEGLTTTAEKLLKSMHVLFVLLCVVCVALLAVVLAVAFVPESMINLAALVQKAVAVVLGLLVCSIDVVSTVAFVQFMMEEKSRRADLPRDVKIIANVGMIISPIALISLVVFGLSRFMQDPLAVDAFDIGYLWGINTVSALWMIMKVRIDNQTKRGLGIDGRNKEDASKRMKSKELTDRLLESQSELPSTPHAESRKDLTSRSQSEVLPEPTTTRTSRAENSDDEDD
jgi:hypothetical protein